MTDKTLRAAHDDEYDALARQFHESIADGQTVTETAKALRLLAAQPATIDVEPDCTCPQEWIDRNTAHRADCLVRLFIDRSAAQPATIDVERLAQRLEQAADNCGLWLIASEWRRMARELARLTAEGSET